MVWFSPWSDGIKKRALRYLLQRYLGRFLEEKLSLDQLSVDLYDGTGVAERLSLDCAALNELGEAQGWPFEFVSGYVERVSVSVPWATLLRDDSHVQADGLAIALRPKTRSESAASMFESMWSSMTSSMQLAAECLKREAEDETIPQPVEGIERFAQTIDSVLSRVKVKFSNATFRIEHAPPDSSAGVALEIRIKNIEYLDEAGSDPPVEFDEDEKNKTYVVSTFTVKRISFEGVTLYTDEFPSAARTMSRSATADPFENTLETCFYSMNNLPNVAADREPIPEDDGEKIKESDPILFARIAGKQEIRLKMKQSEEVVGPKVDFQLTLGSFTSILSPRQFHVLLEMANALAEPHLEDNRNMCMKSKPMQKHDFAQVEAQLTGGLAQLTGERGITYLLSKNRWSTPNIDDSDQEEETFLPLESRHDKLMTDSIGSSGSMSSSFTSNASSATFPSTCRSGSPHGSKRKKGNPYVDCDPDAETSHINIRMASLAIVLLHEDILTLENSPKNDRLTASSVKLMKNVAENFFKKIGLLAISGYGSKDLDNANKAFDKAITYNNMRLIAAPVIVEGNEKVNSQGLSIIGHLSMAKIDIRESLYNTENLESTIGQIQSIPILKFDKDGDAMKDTLKIPNIKISFNKLKKCAKVSGERRYTHPKTEINILVDQCLLEVDLSIIDRISSLLYSQPICNQIESSKYTAYFDKTTNSERSIADFFTEIKIKCPLIRVHLRFPIADLRPMHQRMPWWQRAVRDDYLLLTLQDSLITNLSSHNQSSTDIKVQCKKIDIFYLKSLNDPEIHLACATGDGLTSNLDTSKINLPTISINILPSNKPIDGLLDFTTECEGGSQNHYYGNKNTRSYMGHSSMLFMDNINSTNSNSSQPGPFSSKKMVHESDTPHSKNNEDDPEELVVPGDSTEMKDFYLHSIKNSLLQIKCELPVVSVQLISKQLYEVLYNRINSDLLLWEPTAPKARKPNLVRGTLEEAEFSKSNINDSMYQVFAKCKSNTNYNSDSDSSSSSTDSNVYYSVYDQKMKKSKIKNTPDNLPKTNKGGLMNNICFQLQIGKGQLTMYTPVRDNLNHVLPVQQGEIVILVEDLSLCHVGGVGSDVNKALLSLQATDANLYHCGLIPTPSEKLPLRLYGSALPSYLKHIMYPSDKGLLMGNHGNNTGREVISLAISIKPSKEYSDFKIIKLAAGISNMILYHIMITSQHSWLNQIMDMIDVSDYPIAGYEPSTVVTELHIHLWDCAIDYRPIHLPLHSVITLGNFSISSNVVAQTNASNLRFIAEECALFLSDEVQNTKKINLKKNFVCVIDLGLFELSLRLNEKSISTVPRVDLRASNNVVHVRTCSDSFKSLCRLITYLASDGDFNDPENFDSSASDFGSGICSSVAESDHGSSKENDLLGVIERVPEEIRDLSKSQVQHVNDLMAEAMIENAEVESDDKQEGHIDESGVEVFFFPDESKTNNSNLSTSPNQKNYSVLSEMSDVNEDLNVNSTNPSYNNTDPTLEAELHSFSIQTDDDGSLISTPKKEPPISIVTKDLGDFSLCQNIEIIPKTHKKSSGDNTDDEFCILGEDFTAVKRKNAEPKVHWLTSEPVNIIDNHFTVPIGKTDLLKPPKNFPMAVLRYTLCEMTLIWHMYGGNDFKLINTNDISANQSEGKNNFATPNKKTVTINEPSSRHSPTLSQKDPYSIIPKSVNNYGNQRAIYYQGAIGYNKGAESVSQIPPKERTPGSPREIPWRHRGGQGRRHDVLMELQLNKIRFQHETYPSDGVEASRQVLIISSVEIRDRLASSQINKFLYQYTSELRPKQKHANMVVIKAVHIRPDPKLSTQECCLKVSLLPLRFNIDQDALLFLVGFFGQLGESEPPKENTMNSTNSGSNQSLHSIGGSSRHSTPTHQPPIMSVNTSNIKTPGLNSRRTSYSNRSGADIDNIMTNSDCISEDTTSIREEEGRNDAFIDSYEAERLVSENLILLEEDMKLDYSKPHNFSIETTLKSTSNPNHEVVDDLPVYFRNVVFSPDVPIRLDYHGKRVDLTHGPLAGLLMGLGQLNCSELRLKSLSYRHGLLGLERLIKWVLQEWLSDIKRRQLPGLLGGVGPMHSLVQLFQGIRDLFWLPIEQYQRDGRLVRGLQRGASSFTTSTAMAALDITARIIHLIQATAETAYDMVSPSPGLRGPRGKRRRRHDKVRQPQDIREGIANAYHLVKEGLGETAQALADVATTEHAARGYSGAVGGVLRQLPPTAIAPVLLASEAAVGFLGGVRATLAPADHKDHRNKWRAPIDGNNHTDTGMYSDN